MRWRWGRKTVTITMSRDEAEAFGRLLNEWAKFGGSWVDQEDCQNWKRSAVARENRRETITYNNLRGTIEAFFGRDQTRKCRELAAKTEVAEGRGE